MLETSSGASFDAKERMRFAAERDTTALSANIIAFVVFPEPANRARPLP